MRQGFRVLLCLMAALAFCTPASLAAVAHKKHKPRAPLKPLLVHLNWRLSYPSLGSGGYLYASATTIGPDHRYVLLTQAHASDSIVIDAQTGSRTSVASIRQKVCSAPSSPGQLAPGSLGSSLLTLDQCGPAAGDVTAYSLSNGNWESLNSSTYCQGNCGGTPVAGVAGDYWLAWSWTQGYCPEHCGPPTPAVYQNIYTGQWRALPQDLSSTNLLDPDSPTLTRRACRPVQVSGGNFYDFYFHGSFAVDFAPTPTNRSPLNSYLQRCGSSKRVLLKGYWGAVGDSHLIISADYSARNPTTGVPSRLVGTFLPSLRQFRAQLPAPLRQNGIGDQGLAVSSTTIYAVSADQQEIWTAPRPKPPPPRSA